MSNIRDLVISEVAKACDVRVADLLAPSRSKKPIAEARQVAMWVFYHINGKNAAAAGRVFGREQTTARHAVTKVSRDAKLKKIGKPIVDRFASDVMVAG